MIENCNNTEICSQLMVHNKFTIDGMKTKLKPTKSKWLIYTSDDFCEPKKCS